MTRLHVLEYIRDPQGVWSLPAAELDRLRANFPGVEFLAPADRPEADRLLPEADVVLGWAVRPENFDRAGQLKWIQITAAGVGSLLFPALIDSPVVVTNGRGLHAVAMAEHTIAVLFGFARRLHLARDAQRERVWAQEALLRGPGFMKLEGTRLGLVGLGSVGAEIAVRARALGLEVVAVRRRPSADPAPADAQWGVEALDELLATSDWVVLAAPLTEETRGLIGARELARMRPGAVLVNLGRGGLVDEAALVEALRSGRLGGAALDVVEHEPLPVDSPLWDLPGVILTPHVSGLGPRYWERAMDLFAENLRRYLADQPLLNTVDKRAGY
jgi:phosphoglycerate dehydrogenase-like enzyme